MLQVRHDVRKFFMTSKTGLATNICQKFVMKLKIRHDVKKFVMKLKHVSYDVRKFVMPSKRKTSIMTLKSPKVRHDVTKFVKMSKNMVMMTIGSSLLQKVRHEVKNMSWCQKVIIKSKTRHEAKKSVMTSKTSWRQQFVITSKTRHPVKGLSWRQKFVMKSKRRHVVKTFVMI